MGDKPALVLVPDVSQDGAPQIEHPVTLLASELGSPVGSLDHGYGVHLSLINSWNLIYHHRGISFRFHIFQEKLRSLVTKISIALETEGLTELQKSNIEVLWL